MILSILRYGHPTLKKVSEPVTEFNRELETLAQNMIETMHASRGIGLAAPQVGNSIRLIVVDVTSNQSAPLILVNPKIIEKSKERQTFEEGCLSFPGVFEKLGSSAKITVEYQLTDGSKVQIGAEGILAVCIQHEIDHLDGRLIFDRMNKKAQTRLKTLMMGGKLH